MTEIHLAVEAALASLAGLLGYRFRHNRKALEESEASLERLRVILAESQAKTNDAEARIEHDERIDAYAEKMLPEVLKMQGVAGRNGENKRYYVMYWARKQWPEENRGLLSIALEKAVERMKEGE